MSRKTLTVLTLGVAVVFLLSSAGCISKKRFRTAEEQNAQKLAQANARIDELEKKSSALAPPNRSRTPVIPPARCRVAP